MSAAQKLASIPTITERELCPHCGKVLKRVWVAYSGVPHCLWCARAVSEKRETRNA